MPPANNQGVLPMMALWPLLAIAAGMLMSMGRGITIRLVWIACAFSVAYVLETFGKAAHPIVRIDILTNLSLGVMCLGIGFVISIVLKWMRER
jgi:hypothetical protein